MKRNTKFVIISVGLVIFACVMTILVWLLVQNMIVNQKSQNNEVEYAVPATAHINISERKFNRI